MPFLYSTVNSHQVSEFDCNAFGGAAGSRTPIHTKPRIRLYKLSAIRQALKCFGQLHKRHIRFELCLSHKRAVEGLKGEAPLKMTSASRSGDIERDEAD